jgi:large subunit ribosomal protein L13
MVTTVDATGLILGRMATYVAKLALMGEKVNIVNCEKAVISGSQSKLDKMHKLRSMGSPFHGPFYPKKAERIVKRTIKGMLPSKQQRGRDALSRVRCYIGQPDEIDTSNLISFPKASGDKIAAIKTIKIKTVSERI